MGIYDFTFYDLINRNAGCYSAKDAWYEVDSNKSLTFLQIKEEVDKSIIEKRSVPGELPKSEDLYHSLMGPKKKEKQRKNGGKREIRVQQHYLA